LAKESITPEQVREAIAASGFPFELQVANRLIELGYEVEPSSRFYDKQRQKDVEIDLVARSSKRYQTKGGKEVECQIQLAIECKDNSLPFVFFGLDRIEQGPPGTMDRDYRFAHISSTRDRGQPDRQAMACFLNDKEFKKHHHHFASQPPRFYLATTLEWRNKILKITVTDNLQDAIRKLASFVQYYSSMWAKMAKEMNLEEMNQGIPKTVLTFLLLVHSGQQFRYSFGNHSITEATHTVVFQSLYVAEAPVQVVVDFVSADKLTETIKVIERTRDEIAPVLVPSLLADARA
jgi:hypothetical protein